MIFKEIRYLIYDRLDIIIGKDEYRYVDINDSDTDKFDYLEVIGIRAGIEYYDNIEEEKVVISLRETDTVHYGNFDLYLTDNSDEIVSAERARGK